MSYLYQAYKRNPVALWMLDDTPSYEEYMGLGYVGDTAPSSSAATVAPPLVANAKWASVFDNTRRGRFQCPFFKAGLESQVFALETWILPVPQTTTAVQKVLSHNTVMDGITIQGTAVRFSIAFATAPVAECSYDLVVNRAAHVVGMYTSEQILLYVDGELVDHQTLSDEQRSSKFATSDGYLYVGESTANQKVAMNAVAIYSKASADTFSSNFAAGRNVMTQTRVAAQFGAKVFSIYSGQGSRFLDRSWTDRDDFLGGYLDNVGVSEEAVVPSELGTVSEAGSWTCGVALDDLGDTNIYGVAVEWSASGATVEASLDGTTWTAIQNGRLVGIIPQAFDPTGKDLQVRFSFAGGVTEDPSFVESVRIVGFRNTNVETSEVRTVSYTHPAVLREDYEPIAYRDDNGINLNTGTLTIGQDTSDEPEAVRTVEMWIKPLGTTNWSVSGTQYINGVANSGAITSGQWSLVHVVTAANVTNPITISGNCIVGQVNLYTQPLTAANIKHLYDCYTGTPVIRITDTGAVVVSEDAEPAKLYTHAWSIDGAGG